MRKRSLLAAVSFLLAGVFAFDGSPARAATVTIHFYGTIDASGALGPFSPGTTVEGSLSFRTDLVDTQFPDPTFASYRYPNFQPVIAAQVTFADPNADQLFVYGLALGPPEANELLIYNGAADPPVGPIIDGLAVGAPLNFSGLGPRLVSFAIELKSLQDILPSDAIPTADLVNQLGSYRARLTAYDNTSLIDFQPVLFSAVPELVGAPLLATALAVAALARRRAAR